MITPADATCPDGWTCADIGNPSLAGGQSLSNGTWTVQGAGNDIWGTADQFHYVWQNVLGDSSIVARLTSQQNTNNCAKAGIMYRADTSAGAVNFTVIMLPDCHYSTPSIQVNYRNATGGDSTTVVDTPFALPIYMEAVRRGSTFTAYTSSDGVSWTQLGSSVILNAMPNTALVGIVVSSHNGYASSTATFDSVLGSNPLAGGTVPWHPHHDVRLSDGLNASVDLADGHLDLSQADLSIPGRGNSDLDLVHTWDSVLAQSSISTTAGAGWLDSLSPRMGGMLTGTVAFTDSTGAVWSYPYSGALTATAPYTQYAVPPGDPWQLSTASSGYTLTNPLSGETLTFDNQGRYLADTDVYGNAASVTYSGASSQPITWTAAGGFTSPNGRALSLAYTGQGLLSDVQSPLWRKSGGSQGRHVTFGYNSSGQLTTLTRGAGTTDAVTETFGYSGTQLVTVTTPAGRSWLIGYDAAGRVSSLTSPISGTTPQQMGYTPAYTTTFSYMPGQTQLVVGAGTTGALTTTYTLDVSGEATAIADGLSDMQHLSYDQDHDVLTSQDADGNITTNYYEYVGPSGNIGLITETLSPPVATTYPWAIPQSWPTSYRYDPTTYDLLETDSPSGGITRYGYDGHHSVLTSTVLLAIAPCQAAVRRGAPLGPRPAPGTGLSLFPGGRPSSGGVPPGAGLQPEGVCQTYSYQWRATVNRYDADGELVSTVDGRGLDTTTDVTGTVSLDPSSALSYTTSYTYTPNGDLASVTTPPITTLQNGTPTTGPVTTTDGYGTDGDLTAQTSPNGATTTTSYNHLGQVIKVTQPSVPVWSGGNTSPIETTSYDPEGNVVKTVDAAGDVSVSSYDPLGRLVASTNPVSGTTVYTYSATEQTATQDPQGDVTQSSYDAAGRLSQRVDPSGAVTQYADDPAGNTTSITSTDSDSDVLALETRQYDALNRLISDTVSGPNTAPQTTVTSYDPDGNAVQVQQPNGDVVFDTYDLADELNTEEVDPAAVMTQTAPTFLLYSYDMGGNLSSVGDLDGRVTQNAFDAANHLSQSVALTGTTTITTTPQYDPAGNTVSQTTQTQAGSGPVQTHTVTSTVNALDWTTSASDDGLVTSYGYDAAGQERTEAVLNGTQPVTTTLDAEGRASSIADGLAGTVAYSYNADDLPLTVTLPGGLLEQPQYDGASRLSTLTLTGPTTASTPLSSTYGYGYSPLDWTTALTSTLNGLTNTQALTHDANGRLTGWSSGGSIQSWTYDGNGNLTLSLSNTVPTTYTYGNGMPNELSKLQTPGQYTRKYAYDQQGDTTAITTTGAYSAALQYDSQARLVGVTFKSGQVVTMTYNAQGQRASYAVTQPGQPAWSAQFQYRGALLGQATIISGSTTYTDTYLYDQSGNPLELLRQQNGSISRYWYVLDGRDNVVALTDINGNVVDRYAYDAWGAPTTVSETVPQRLRYAGYWYDAELGWYWVSVRSYDPVLKRWLQPDPSQQDGLRTFVYADDDPSDVTDPSGFAPFTCKAGYHINYYRGGHFCEQDSGAKPVNPCDVFLFGYFCGRNLQARAQQWLIHNAPVVAIVYFAQGTPPDDDVRNASNSNAVGDWAEKQAVARMQELGYKRIDVNPQNSYNGPDVILERVGKARVPSGGWWPEFVFLESKGTVIPGKTPAGPSLRQQQFSWYESYISRKVSDPVKVREIREAFRSGKVRVLLARTDSENLTTFEDITLMGAPYDLPER